MKRETKDKIIWWAIVGAFAAAIVICGVWGLLNTANY